MLKVGFELGSPGTAYIPIRWPKLY